jgi:pyruvate, water dikinase
MDKGTRIMSDIENEANESVEQCLDRCLDEHPEMVGRFYRQLMMYLHLKNIASVEDITKEARASIGLAPGAFVENPNVSAAQRFDDAETEAVHRLTRDYVLRHLTATQVRDVVNYVLKREEAQSVADVANLPSVSFRVLAERLHRFCALPLGEMHLDPSELFGVRVALARHFISDDLAFLGFARKYLRVRDYEDITNRSIGNDSRMGRVGGKAGGMLLASKIVEEAGLDAGDNLPITVPDSYYVRSDVLEQFLELNGLRAYHSQKYKNLEDIRNEYPLVKGVFRNSTFPIEVVQQLRALLEKLSDVPLIVRSSSLLEDRLTSAFSGKYASIFLPNQGDLETRLRAILGAIGEVYASTLSADPILYRRKHNLIDYDEEMAILIQTVIGQKCGRYFLPAFAGVAFSRNEYRWSPRIRREDGFVRLVMGLGTRAVDRVGGDYPRMVALGAPTLRPDSSAVEIIKHSQKSIDVINLESNRFESISLATLLEQNEHIPMLDKIVSIRRENELYTPPGTIFDASPEDMCITFDKLLKNTPFAERVLKMLRELENALEHPVDVEFVCDGEKFYMLQCRAQQQSAESARVVVPDDIPQERIVFTANRFVRTAKVPNIEYIIYVSSAGYHGIDSNEGRLAMARAIGRVNQAIADKRFILIGPGRWGSNDLRLGVRVSYADISNAQMLIEVAREHSGYIPELSFGTHFFQDLVEDNIAYLPLYPDEPGSKFDTKLLRESPSVLASVSAKDESMASILRVIHVPAVTGGLHLHVAMDGESDRAVAYLARSI